MNKFEEFRKAAAQIAGHGRADESDVWLSYCPIGEGVVRRRDLRAALKVLRWRVGMVHGIVPGAHVWFRWKVKPLTPKCRYGCTRHGELRLRIHQPEELGMWRSAP